MISGEITWQNIEYAVAFAYTMTGCIIGLIAGFIVVRLWDWFAYSDSLEHVFNWLMKVIGKVKPWRF